MKWKKQNRGNLTPGEEDCDTLVIEDNLENSSEEEADDGYSSSSLDQLEARKKLSNQMTSNDPQATSGDPQNGEAPKTTEAPTHQDPSGSKEPANQNVPSQ